MLTNFIAVGDRIELQAVERSLEEKKTGVSKTYVSKVQDILSEDRLEIAMPMEQMKLVLLPIDAEYNLFVYSASGVYQCFARIKDRYKSNNIYLLVVELTTNMRKFQRREYYRFSCALEMGARPLEDDELDAVEEKRIGPVYDGKDLKKSIIVDISGGGLRFLSAQKYEPDSLILCSYHLLKSGEKKEYSIAGKVLTVKQAENRPGIYEHRVQYHNMSEEVREEIIRFIFEEERRKQKNRK